MSEVHFEVGDTLHLGFVARPYGFTADAWQGGSTSSDSLSFVELFPAPEVSRCRTSSLLGLCTNKSVSVGKSGSHRFGALRSFAFGFTLPLDLGHCSLFCISNTRTDIPLADKFHPPELVTSTLSSHHHLQRFRCRYHFGET